jgi:cyclase
VHSVTPHVFTSTDIRGCNPSYVVTSAGVVVIDTPQLPTRAIAMRREAEEHGPIQYVINTEHHVDHIFGNYWFKGAGHVVHHQGVADNFMTPTPDLDPFAYALEAIPTDDPGAADIVPDRDTYYEDPNRGDLVFTGDLEMTVGGTTFHLIHTPGHTPGQVAYRDTRDGTLIAGDAFQTLGGIAVAGKIRPLFPLPAFATWHKPTALESARTLRELQPSRLAVGHGDVVESPVAAMDGAIADAS